jgi:large subunit ribosomal protein L9
MMKLKVILLKDVPKLGTKGSVCEVADGFGKNYLIPRGLAQVATNSAVANLNYHLEISDKKSAKAKAKAEEAKAAIETKTLEVQAKDGPTGTLFGSVTAETLAKSIKRELKYVIDRHDIIIENPIKTCGMHTIKVKLHHDVEASLKIEVKNA